MNWKKIKAMVLAFIGISADNKDILAFTDEQKTSLDAKVKTDGFAEKFMAKYNEELDSTKELDAATEEIDAFMAEEASEEEDPANDGLPKADVPELSLSAKIKAQNIKLKALQTENEKQKAINAKLSGDPEPDHPAALIKGNKAITMKHSKTHIFGSNNTFDAFEGRNWNKLMAGFEGAVATTWNTANIDQLNTDIQNYFRKDPKMLMSVMLDGFVIPPFWDVISGVSDEYIFTTIATGSITQGLKVKWLPKNNAKFEANKGKVRDIQIDIEFNGNELKKLEKSYLNNFFNQGSTPYKDKFIMFVVTELLRKARKEDKIVLGKGVYYPNTDADKAGSFLNNFSGVVKLALEARDNLYKSFKLGTPTTLNIFSYVNSMAESLPYDIRIQPDLVLYLSKSWIRAYNKRRAIEIGRDQDYKGKIMHIEGFENIELYGYDQLEGSDFMFITTKDNIYILTDKPGEHGVLQFERDTRNTKVFGDYKLAAFIAMFGRKLIDPATGTYDNQLFFSNDVEALTDVYVPVEADNATPTLVYHNSLKIGANNTAATNITNLTNAVAGSRVYLLGDADANYSTVKDNANILLLDGDCVLTKNQLLVLFVKADGKFQELMRKTVGVSVIEEAQVVIAADATSVDVSEGTNFVTSANTAATALVGITNGVIGETYRITGGSADDSTTIADAGIFALSAAMTLGLDAYIDLYYNGVKFIETARG
jgi:hypothetical protein